MFDSDYFLRGLREQVDTFGEGAAVRLSMVYPFVKTVLGRVFVRILSQVLVLEPA